MYQTLFFVEQRWKKVSKNMFVNLFNEALWRRSCALVIRYFHFVFGFWNAVPNQSYPSAKTLNEFVECVLFWSHFLELSRRDFSWVLACSWYGFLYKNIRKINLSRPSQNCKGALGHTSFRDTEGLEYKRTSYQI